MLGGWRPGGSVAGGCAVLLLLWPAPGAGAAAIGVSTIADETSADAHCSLREAISAANADSKGPGGDCTKGGGTDTINVPGGHYTLGIANANENANATGDLDVLSNLTIA